MKGSMEDTGAPDSWEMADLDESMSRLMVNSKNNSASFSSSSSCLPVSEFADESSAYTDTPASTIGSERNGGGSSDDAVNQVDQFLREALQNPRERVSILRMEQEVEKFIRDPARRQLEFQQLPTSYLRLAAHRVAEHYFLQSMVLVDSNLPDTASSRIIVQKTSNCRSPLVRLADIPFSLSREDKNTAVKVAIKRRPEMRSQMANSGNSHHSKSSHAKSVEERKAEYNRARARIFSSNTADINGVSESEPVVQDNFPNSRITSRNDDKSVIEESRPEVSLGRTLPESSIGSSRSDRGRTEKEPVSSRFRANNRVAIFRDRDVDVKDPDYDRSYDRYMQRFDPGFGFSGGPYTMQALYTPALNYNTEFPQLGPVHRPQVPVEHHPQQISQHLRGPFGASGPPETGFGPPEATMGPFNSPNYVGTNSTSQIYLQSSHYPVARRPGMSFVNQHGHDHQSYTQTHQQQQEASFGLARPR